MTKKRSKMTAAQKQIKKLEKQIEQIKIKAAYAKNKKNAYALYKWLIQNPCMQKFDDKVNLTCTLNMIMYVTDVRISETKSGFKLTYKEQSIYYWSYKNGSRNVSYTVEDREQIYDSKQGLPFTPPTDMKPYSVEVFEILHNRIVNL